MIIQLRYDRILCSTIYKRSFLSRLILQVNTTVETINYCESKLCKHRGSLSGSGLVSYSLRAGLNTSYCVLLRSQHPSCLREDAGEEAELPAYCALQVSHQIVCISLLISFRNNH